MRGGRLVFADVSFALAPGEVLLLRGPNGAGKSSLLRLLAGFLAPSAGTLWWDGRPALADTAEHRARLHLIGHGNAIKGALTVGENLCFAAAVAGAPAAPLERALGGLRAGRARRRCRPPICPPGSGGASRSPACWRARARSGCWTSPTRAWTPPVAPAWRTRWPRIVRLAASPWSRPTATSGWRHRRCWSSRLERGIRRDRPARSAARPAPRRRQPAAAVVLRHRARPVPARGRTGGGGAGAHRRRRDLGARAARGDAEPGSALPGRCRGRLARSAGAGRPAARARGARQMRRALADQRPVAGARCRRCSRS